MTASDGPAQRRAFVVVLDACGAGALPDAADYGDAGADTLGHVAEAAGGFDLPTLTRLGLGSIPPDGPYPGTRECPDDRVVHGRLRPLGPGKDTTAGHWELMGVVAEKAAPTFPDGFDAGIRALVAAVCGADGILCNAPYNGIKAIEDFGDEHLATGRPILYTSADSVLQIAAHVDVLPTDRLHEACAEIREQVPDVGRVIARPFAGAAGAFARTDRRKDFALPPPARSYLDALRERGVRTHSVGKVAQVFAGVGIDASHPGPDNARGIATTTELIRTLDERALVFVNLVDTDQVYGHRQDPLGFHGALREIDGAVDGWLGMLRPDHDLLILTADHGCDPTPAVAGSDHTREHAPLLAWFPGHGGRRHDGLFADVGASVFAWLTGGAEDAGLPGRSFL